MSIRKHDWHVLAACVLAAAFVACESAAPTDPLAADALAPLFKKAPGGNGDGTVTAELTGALAGTHAGKNYKENRRQTEVSGGPRAALGYGFAGALARFEAGQCIAARGSADGPALDAATASYLADFLVSEEADVAFYLTYDRLADGQPSDSHDLGTSFADAAGRAVRIGIFAHGDPAPTIHRDGDTFSVSEGVVRVWLVDGPSRNHPKLFCPNPSVADGGDEVVVTVQR
jgi:hypothetical protein